MIRFYYKKSDPKIGTKYVGIGSYIPDSHAPFEEGFLSVILQSSHAHKLQSFEGSAIGIAVGESSQIADFHLDKVVVLSEPANVDWIGLSLKLRPFEAEDHISELLETLGE